MATRRARYKSAARKAKAMTNKQLGSELAALAPISKEALDELLPKKRDKEQFMALMQQVEKEQTMDENLAFLGDNLQTAGTVVFKMLKIFT